METNLRAANIRTGVDQSLNVCPKRGIQVESECLGEGQVRAIATLLIPALDGGADGAGDYSQVEHLWNSPFVFYLGLQGHTFFLGKLVLSENIVVILRILGDQRPFLQDIGVLDETFLISKVFNLGYELVLGDSGKRVLDLGIKIGRKVGTVDCRRVMNCFLCVGIDFMLRP